LRPLVVGGWAGLDLFWLTAFVVQVER
jgi:hypothetical protein